MAKSWENAHLSPLFAQHPCLKTLHKIVFLSTPSGTSGCLMSMPFVLNRNSCASFAAFFALSNVLVQSSSSGRSSPSDVYLPSRVSCSWPRLHLPERLVLRRELFQLVLLFLLVVHDLLMRHAAFSPAAILLRRRFPHDDGEI